MIAWFYPSISGWDEMGWYDMKETTINIFQTEIYLALFTII